MIYLLLAISYLLFAVLSWKRLNWAVLLVIAGLPTYLIRFRLGPLPMTFLEGMILITIIVWIVKRKAWNLHVLRSTFYVLRWPLALFLITATAAMLVAPDLRAAAGAWKAYFIEPILFFIVLNDLLTCGQLSKKHLISALSVTALLLSLYAIYQRFTGFGIPTPWDAERRVTSIFPYPNALGLFLGPLVPLFIVEFFTNKKLLTDSYWLITIITTLATIIFAKSTGALVGVAAGLLVMAGLWFISRNRAWRNESGIRNQKLRSKKSIIHNSLFIIPLATIIALAITWTSFPQLRGELFLRDWSGHVRRTQWTETWEMLKDRPLLGAGLAGYKKVLAPYHKATYLEIFEYPHNLVLNFWSETGLLGLVAFLWLVVTFFYSTFKKLGSRYYLLGPIAAMVTLLIHGLVDVPYFKNDLAILFWIVYALGVANNKNTYATSNQTL